MNRLLAISVVGVFCALDAMAASGVETGATAVGPADAKPGSCYAKTTTPAVIQTITKQYLTSDPTVDDEGNIVKPASYRTETVQQIVRERVYNWFETPCAADLGPEYIPTLQRALKARGHFRGWVSGVMDKRTRRAIKRYQSAFGLESDELSLEFARKLGLVAYPEPE